MTDVTTTLYTELEAATGQATAAGDDLDLVLAALDRFAEFVTALDNTRLHAGQETRKLIAIALRQGVDPRDLYGRPFSGTIVREIAKENGIDVGRSGPRPRRLPRT